MYRSIDNLNSGNEEYIPRGITTRRDCQVNPRVRLNLKECSISVILLTFAFV